ncbi:MAG: hypothetical protein JRE45_20735 [Deltaproteobacteria bacterium]|nr:hypothetical protein [Deltaproteobacteria bacterium]
MAVKPAHLALAGLVVRAASVVRVALVVRVAPAVQRVSAAQDRVQGPATKAAVLATRNVSHVEALDIEWVVGSPLGVGSTA